MPLTSTREATAALSKEPAQRGTSGVSLIAALHAAARPQRSGMARAPAGMRARRREETSAPPASQVPFPPVLLPHPAVLGLTGSWATLGRREGPGSKGGTKGGRSSKVQLFVGDPANSVSESYETHKHTCVTVGIPQVLSSSVT